MRGDPRTEELLKLLEAIAEESWALVAEESRLIQRRGQLAEAANQLRPLAKKILSTRAQTSGTLLTQDAA